MKNQTEEWEVSKLKIEIDNKRLELIEKRRKFLREIETDLNYLNGGLKAIEEGHDIGKSPLIKWAKDVLERKEQQ